MSLKSRVIMILSFAASTFLIILFFTVFKNTTGAIIATLLIFTALYLSFEKLLRSILERDDRLKEINQTLELEIKERKNVEEELSIHRDYLEGLITEGTRELQIKNQELEASEKKFRAITTSIQDAIVMINASGHVSFWNKAAQRIFGYSPEQIQGEKLYHLIVPNHHDRKNVNAFEIFKPADKEKIVEKIIEVEARRKNGELFPIELAMSVVDIQGELNTVAVIRDVTLKKAGERDIKILSSAVEQSSVGIMITDTEGVIQYVNPRFTEVTGYSKEEVLGKTPNILNSNTHKPDFFDELWNTIRSGNVWHGELQNRKKNGELYWDSSLISPIKDSHGLITHYVAVKEDITLRKRMEVELVSARKTAEAASRAKSEFLANMSHEIRTPMNAIIGMTELILDTRVTKEQREYLNIVQVASNSLLSLLNDILDLSKIEAGKLMLEPIPFDIQDCLTETVKTMAIQAHKKALELIYDIDVEVPLKLIGDVGRLRQVIMNLIGNSIKFAREGEIVFKVEVLEELPDDRVLLHFMVSDTGIGIAEDKLGKIFEKFSQADTSITRKYGGTGLGLTISSKLVKLMNGVIWAESPATFPHFAKSDIGSTFHFTAAFAIDRTALQSRKIINIDPLQGVSVLVVADNPTSFHFLSDVLSKYNMQPLGVHSVNEAIKTLKENSFKLLIVDLREAETDGADFLQYIHHSSYASVPVIFLSSGIKPDTFEILKPYHPFTPFLKPVNTFELLAAISDVLGLRKKEVEEIVTGHSESISVEANDGYHILVVEDNPINQHLIKRLLEKKGHMVDIADNGEEAIEKFHQHPARYYRIIFMDIQMPIMDGVIATQEIRKTDSDIPIIALTAHAMKGDQGKFMAEGMNDYISKPIKKALLFEILNKYISPDDKGKQ